MAPTSLKTKNGCLGGILALVNPIALNFVGKALNTDNQISMRWKEMSSSLYLDLVLYYFFWYILFLTVIEMTWMSYYKKKQLNKENTSLN